jgi:hypothetical protein
MDYAIVVVFIGSIYVAIGLAEHRGRSVKRWAEVAAIIGPLALPIMLLLPNLRRH